MPPWQAQQAWRRVVRGESFDNSPENLRSANRDNDHPENRNENDGFRCVRVPPTCRCEQRHAAPVGATCPTSQPARSSSLATVRASHYRMP
jgi:hypothetical protein